MIVTALQSDIRETALPPDTFDLAVAAATLHHVREDAEWQNVFRAVYQSLKPGGSFWIWDLVAHEPAALHEFMWVGMVIPHEIEGSHLSRPGLCVHRR